MDSRRAALAVKPSQPLLRTDRLHWECRCCVRPQAPLIEFSAGRRPSCYTCVQHGAVGRQGVLIPCSAFAHFTHSPLLRRRHLRRA
jgi:hypothetical protein